MSVSEIKDFIFENHYKRIGFSKDMSYFLYETLEKKKCYCLKTN